MSSSPGTYWYALQVQANSEITVSACLRHLGIREYLPLHVYRRRIDQQSLTASRKVLLPGYIFCWMDLKSGPKLYKVPGFIRIVGSGKTPVPIMDEEIEAVRRIADTAAAVEPWPHLPSGEKIRVTAGPFAGTVGTVIRCGRSKRLIVSLPLLQRALAVTIPSQWVMSEVPVQ